VCELARPNADWATYEALLTDGDIAAAEGDLVALNKAALHLQEVEDGKVKTQDLPIFILLHVILNCSARFFVVVNFIHFLCLLFCPNFSIFKSCYFALIFPFLKAKCQKIQIGKNWVYIHPTGGLLNYHFLCLDGL
jgi:hypothetical protein